MIEQANIVIIGSGISGGIMVAALVDTGKKIVILERGEWLKETLNVVMTIPYFVMDFIKLMKCSWTVMASLLT